MKSVLDHRQGADHRGAVGDLPAFVVRPDFGLHAELDLFLELLCVAYRADLVEGETPCAQAELVVADRTGGQSLTILLNSAEALASRP